MHPALCAQRIARPPRATPARAHASRAHATRSPVRASVAAPVRRRGDNQRARVSGANLDAVDDDAGAAPSAAAVKRTFEWDRTDVFTAYGTFATILAVGSTDAASRAQYAFVPYFAALALSSMYIGAHRGLTRTFRETISFESSLAGPVVLSVALFSAYLALEVFHLDISWLVNGYFFVLGAIAVGGNAVEPLNALGTWWKTGVVEWKVPDGWAVDPKTGVVVKDAEVNVTPAQILGGVFGVALASADADAGHLNFTLNNAIACMIVTDFLSVIGFGSFKSAATLLSGLLVYDAFWVFKSEEVLGQNVMMSVATNQSFNGPFRLLFPRFEDVLNPAPIDAFPFSLVGLGDIAVPGLLISLMLRYDASRATDLRARASAAADAFMGIFEDERNERDAGPNMFDSTNVDGDYEADGYRTGIGKRAAIAAEQAYDAAAEANEDAILVPSSLSGRAFFSATLKAYLAGLLVAVGANVATGQGQPALVYLVPATLGVVAYTAFTRDEVSRVFEFVDESREEGSLL